MDKKKLYKKPNLETYGNIKDVTRMPACNPSSKTGGKVDSIGTCPS